MEATTYQTAALIDRGSDDYMLETAILKVFTTEVLWQGVYETLQVFGGQGYFSNEPYERMMRDARINTIGEGANEVLKAFIALVGMRDIGEGLKGTLEGLKKPGSFLPTLWGFTRDRFGRMVRTPAIPVANPDAAADGRFAGPTGRPVRTNRRGPLDRQPRSRPRSPVYPGTDRRRRDRACDLGVHPLSMGPSITRDRTTPAERTAAELYLRMANRRFDDSLQVSQQQRRPPDHGGRPGRTPYLVGLSGRIRTES